MRHDAEGIAELIGCMSRVAAAAEMPIAIERPSGPLVDSLVAAAYPLVVLAISNTVPSLFAPLFWLVPIKFPAPSTNRPRGPALKPAEPVYGTAGVVT